MTLLEFLMKQKGVFSTPSHSVCRTSAAQGFIKVNGITVSDLHVDLPVGSKVTVGKKEFMVNET